MEVESALRSGGKPEFISGIGIHGNVPNDKAYENATYFDYTKFDEAAGFIVKCLNEFVRLATKLADEEKAKFLKEQKLAKSKAA